MEQDKNIHRFAKFNGIFVHDIIAMFTDLGRHISYIINRRDHEHSCSDVMFTIRNTLNIIQITDNNFRRVVDDCTLYVQYRLAVRKTFCTLYRLEFAQFTQKGSKEILL